MVGIRLVHSQDLAGALRVGDQRVLRGAAVLDHPGVAGGIGVVDVQEPRAPVVGREGQREQALLAPRRDLAAQVQEGLGQPPAVAHDLDPAGLLHHEQVAIVAGRLDDVEGLVEVADLPKPHATPPIAGGQPRLALTVGTWLPRRRRWWWWCSQLRRHLPRIPRTATGGRPRGAEASPSSAGTQARPNVIRRFGYVWRFGYALRQRVVTWPVPLTQVALGLDLISTGNSPFTGPPSEVTAFAFPYSPAATS